MSKKHTSTDRNRSILMIEDSTSLSALYQEYLRPTEYHTTIFNLAKPALAWLETHTPDAVLLDLKLPDEDGFEVLAEIKNRGIPTEVLIITAHGSVDYAVQAIRAGAADFLEKPFDAKRLQTSLRNILEKNELKKQVEKVRRTFFLDNFEGFIGRSLEMQAVYRIIECAAKSKATVFITGESGTGKEICAEAIHKQSNRRDEPFVALNCAAIPKDLMESEIFGHVKGAFTGAHAAREGAAGKADGGTLFLDEVCEMDIDLQSKLLRFIQTGSFHRVGSDKSLNVDIRIVCATNRDPMVEVRKGRFREDLYYRLHVIPVALPPLRARGEDILELARHFLIKFSNEEEKFFTELTQDAERKILRYSWPGNVRELENVVRNAVVLNDGPQISAKELAGMQSITGHANEHFNLNQTTDQPIPESISKESGSIRPLWQVEKTTIENAIDQCGGNVPKAASLLEVSPSTLYRKLQSWNT
jgi:two-component system repressor protein LuxO